MSELLTAAQMRAIEQAAIASGEVTGLDLMERAGRGVVEAILEEWPELATTSHRAVVLCGPGNNGGDGFVVARLLRERGWEVEVFLYGDPEKLPPDARVNYERWGEVGPSREIDIFLTEHLNFSPSVVFDAIFGIGLTRPPEAHLRRVFESIHTCRYGSGIEAKIVSVDVASGICADSGRAMAPAPPDGESPDFEPRYSVEADLTVTFHRRKLGHFLADGQFGSGQLRIADLGEPIDKGSNSKQWLHEAAGVPSVPLEMHLLTVRTDEPLGMTDLGKSSAHKYTHGHALILSGPATRTGAARLAARGALRIGAGLVTVATPAPAMAECAAQLTAIMLREANDAADLSNLLEDDRLNALCLGPGMGIGEATRNMVKAALTARRATVLDADALTAFEGEPDALFTMLHETCVLTPHGGEFARLFPDISERLAAPATKGPAYSKVDATREAAARAGCTVLFKGPDTVIANEHGNCRINSSAYDRAAPWLATAGSGDALAGFITGLLARGFAPIEAASTGAWLHTECALSFGPGLIAEDIPEELPKVFRALDL